MGQRFVVAALAGAAWLTGCNDEPPILPGVPDVEVPAMPDMRVPDARPVIDAAPPPRPDVGPPGCPPPMFDNDVSTFTERVAGSLYDACSLCHPAADPGPTFNLSGDAAADAAEAADFVSPSCLLAPATCDIIAWHPEGHPGYVEEPLLGAMVAWIEAGTVIEECQDPEPDPEPEPEPDMGPPETVPCEALPPPGADLARSESYRDEFRRPDGDGVSHNDILVGSCARNGTCHAIAGEGDGYYLIAGADDCAIDWNFFITQIYVDLLDPRSSPLLTLPRDSDGHGGRSVFQGADDERHVRLLRWIQDEVDRSRR